LQQAFGMFFSEVVGFLVFDLAWDKLDSIGYNLKSNISALGGNYSKAALEALISRLYDERIS